jgi:hypothetical protein
MNVISKNLTASEKIEAIAMANAICADISEDYEYNGNHTIADNFEQFYDECNPCCGIKEIELKLSTDKIVFYCFDYGH